MANQTPTLKAEAREKLGSRYAQRLRNDGKLPAVVYGHKQDPVHVAIDSKSFLHELEAGSRVLNVEHADGKTEACLLKDIQFDYLGTNVIHVDLARVDLSEKVSISVAIQIKGEEDSPGAKAPHAFVDQILNSIDVQCKVSDIPESIIADISTLDIGQSIHVKDLNLPDGVETELDPEDTVLIIHLSKAGISQEDEAGEGEGEASSAEPEVITEKKEDA